MSVNNIEDGRGSGNRLAITPLGEALVRGTFVDATTGASASVDSSGRLSTRSACVARSAYSSYIPSIPVLPSVTQLAAGNTARCGAVIQAGAFGLLVEFGGGDPTVNSFQIAAGATFSLPVGTRHTIKAAGVGGTSSAVVIDLVDD